MRQKADELDVDWRMVLHADGAGRKGADWGRLRQLAQHARALPADLGKASGEMDDAWLRRQFEGGIAEIRAAGSEEFTPHMLNLDLLDAVSFDKGCYTGQEIVARTHYRGATRRRMLRYGFSGSADPGDKLMLGDRPVGEVVNVLGDELLAVAPLDDAEAGLTVNGDLIDRKELPYL